MTENPISQGSIWTNGGSVGLDWANVQTTGGVKAWGTQVPSGPGTNDSIAVLTGSQFGTWGTNQTATAVSAIQPSATNEIEVLLHGTITAHNAQLYEFNCSLGYQEIVKWLGALNSFTVLLHNGSVSCPSGAVLKATAVTNANGSVTLTAFINGTQVNQITDSSSPYTGGSPGIGFFIGTGGNNNNAGISTYTATDIISAADCNQSSVNAVINGPTHTAINGDIIGIPAGTCTWNSGITISGKGIDIIGVGTPNTGAGTTGAGTSSTTLLDNIPGNGGFFVFSGLTFGETAKVELMNMNSANISLVGGTGFFPIQFSGTCTASGCPQIRVDNITFGTNNWINNLNDGGFIGTDNVFGVIDHNTANESGASGTAPPFVQIAFSAYLGVGNFGDNSFAAADSYGTANSLFLENNSWNRIRGEENDVATVDGNQGGLRVVCRFNTLVNMDGTGLCSAHGTGSSLGRVRGQRQYEVYYNNVTTGAAGCDAPNGLNSGTGLYLSNIYSSAGCNKLVNLDIFRFVFPGGVFGSCNGTSPFDQTPFSSSSACLDQPGSGLGALLQNSTPVLASAPGTPCNTAGQCWPNPTLDPVYEAGESISPGSFPNPPVTVSSDGSTGRVLANRDYYGAVSASAQTSATSPFNGTSGTGYGTLARRPTTCTPTVGYWATDQGTWNNGGAGGVLYLCTSANTWTSSYTPFTYPHPLTAQTGSSGGGGSPGASLSPGSINFGIDVINVASGGQIATLTNTGTAALTITGIGFVGSDATSFSQTNNCPGSLGAGLNCTITVTFTPHSLGTFAATLSVSDNATGSPQTVALSATAVGNVTGTGSITGVGQIKVGP